MFRLLSACTVFLTVASTIGPASAQPAGSSPDPQPTPATSFRLSGYMFGDFYWIGRHHRPELEGQNGFWFRRVYFTYDHTLSERFAARFRLEMNSAGDFKSATRLTPFVKDAYLRWTMGHQRLVLGMSPTPTFEVVEEVWGYRAVEKTPQDLHQLDGSRDFGVALLGSLDAGARVTYHLMVGNGSDVGSEVDRHKAFRASLGYHPSPRWVVELYAGRENRPGRTTWETLQGFAAYKRPGGRVGLLVTRQVRQGAPGQAPGTLELASGFVVKQVTDSAALFLRADRFFDPSPAGERIPYLPFSPSARSWFLLAGFDLKPDSRVHLLPNVEVVRYDRRAGLRADVVARMTFFFLWP
jgi:hypothetical protein